MIQENEAKVNVTYGGQNGDLKDPVPLDATDADLRTWVTEAVRGGDVSGIEADADASFTDYVIDRFAPTADRPYALVSLRPKTPFG